MKISLSNKFTTRIIFSIKNNPLIKSFSTFKASDLEIEPCTKESLEYDAENLVFGQTFSRHMLTVNWNIEDGWEKPFIHPIRPIHLHPAAKVLHYAAELFEGMKAYRGYDNRIRLFRPELNMKRMNDSAKRAALPNFEGTELIKCIKKLVEVDQESVPDHKKSSLYIRPTLIGTEPSLGVNRSMEALLFVISGPVGPYFPTGFKPVSLLADPQFVRAWEGGCGAYKMGSNYAPTVKIQKEAANKGCQQVLWLQGEDHQVTEVGTMNFFMHWINEHGEEELLTPGLETGIILPGVVRQSILDISRKWEQYKVVEKKLTMSELVKALNERRVLELFGSGTACVVCPIESILYQDELLHIPHKTGDDALAIRLYNHLHDIQYGKFEDHPWVHRID